MSKTTVAPLAGAWIEIEGQGEGLCLIGVAPLAGAWIEIAYQTDHDEVVNSRSPRGSVD